MREPEKAERGIVPVPKRPCDIVPDLKRSCLCGGHVTVFALCGEGRDAIRRPAQKRTRKRGTPGRGGSGRSISPRSRQRTAGECILSPWPAPFRLRLFSLFLFFSVLFPSPFFFPLLSFFPLPFFFFFSFF